MPKIIACMLVAAAVAAALPAGAASSMAGAKAPAGDVAAPPPPPPAYEAQLGHLAQLLGSIDYLRQLCGESDDTDWRAMMQTLIDREARGEEERTRQLTAAFNRGYRSFASVYVTCNESAIAAERQYRREGATLAREIAARYGN